MNDSIVQCGVSNGDSMMRSERRYVKLEMKYMRWGKEAEEEKDCGKKRRMNQFYVLCLLM